jgi:hypothetical protein
MTNKEYFKTKLDSYNQRWNPLSHLKGYASIDKHYKKREKDDENKHLVVFSQTNNNKEVEALINRFKAIVSSFENCERLFFEDGYEMYKQQYYCVVGLQKANQCLDNYLCKFKYTKKDIDDIFVRLEEISNRMETINMRRAYQD